MDWKKYHAALVATGVNVFVMEHDNPSDIVRFAQRAIETFTLFQGRK